MSWPCHVDPAGAVARRLLWPAGMAVRIETTSDGAKAIVSVAGRLVSAEVPEFLRACRSDQGELVLDLTALLSADTAGTEAIRELTRAGAEVRGASPFIQLLLDEQPPPERG